MKIFLRFLPGLINKETYIQLKDYSKAADMEYTVPHFNLRILSTIYFVYYFDIVQCFVNTFVMLMS